MSELVPNLPLLLGKLSDDGLAHELASAFQEAQTEEEARFLVKGIVEQLVEARKAEVTDED